MCNCRSLTLVSLRVNHPWPSPIGEEKSQSSGEGMPILCLMSRHPPTRNGATAYCCCFFLLMWHVQYIWNRKLYMSDRLFLILSWIDSWWNGVGGHVECSCPCKQNWYTSIFHSCTTWHPDKDHLSLCSDILLLKGYFRVCIWQAKTTLLWL